MPADVSMPAPAQQGIESYELHGRCLKVQTDDGLGVAGVFWPAQEPCARVAADLLQRLRCHQAVPAEGIDFLELGAGCGALACSFAKEPALKRVIASDLPDVVPLMTENSRLNGAEIECVPLPFGDLPALEQLTLGPARVVVACEVLYWGGWNIFEDDTREPLAETLAAALAAPLAAAVLAAVIRDPPREMQALEMLKEKGVQSFQQMPASGAPKVGELGIWLLQRHGAQLLEELGLLVHSPS
ncbi:WBGene00275058 [Symbiodinium sp. CCMP2592]|nr:WBGene00275058 [Symbiodinium sp. CCMP2592]